MQKINLVACCIPRYAMLAFLLFSADQTMAQCDTLLRVEGDGILIFSGTVGDTDQVYAARLLLVSNAGCVVESKATSLVDPQTNRFILAGKIEVPATIAIEKGSNAEVIVSVPRPSAPGRYTGTLNLHHQGSKCQWTIPLRLDFRDATEIFDIPQDDEQLSIQTSPPSWFDWLLPSRIQQRGLSFRVENKSHYPAQIERVAVSLKGVSTQRALSETDFDMANMGPALAPKEMRTLQLSLKKSLDLPADEYKGLIQLYLKEQPEPLKANASIFRRSAVGWALLLVLLGIFVGRMLKDLDKASGQMALIDRLFRARRKIASLADATDKGQLGDECDALEEAINSIEGEDAKTLVEQKLATLESKIAQIRYIDQVRERLLAEGAAIPLPILKQMRLLRDAILEGEDAAISEAKGKLDQLLAEQTEIGLESAQKGGSKRMAFPPTEAVVLHKKSAAKHHKPKTFWQKAESYLLKVLAFLSGIRVTARLRYALFRPLAALLALGFFTLLGFQEIYVNGSTSFGSEGAFDYLKLFFWGTISDVASRSLVGGERLKKFMGEPESEPKPEPEG